MINWISENAVWISVLIAAVSLFISIWAIISARRNSKRIEVYNNTDLRLKYRPLVDIENVWKVDPVECTISFNLVSKNNEAHLKRISLLTKDFACSQPRSFPIIMETGEVTPACFSCFHTEGFSTAILSVDIIYEDIIGNNYKTHIEGNRNGYKSTPAQFL